MMDLRIMVSDAPGVDHPHRAPARIVRRAWHSAFWRGRIARVGCRIHQRIHLRLAIVIGHDRRLVLEGHRDMGDARHGLEARLHSVGAEGASHMLHRERDRLLGRGRGKRRSGKAGSKGGQEKHVLHCGFLLGVKQIGTGEVQPNRSCNEDCRQDETRIDNMVWQWPGAGCALRASGALAPVNEPIAISEADQRRRDEIRLVGRKRCEISDPGAADA